MYGLYSRAASNQERPMMARVRYMKTLSLIWFGFFTYLSKVVGIYCITKILSDILLSYYVQTYQILSMTYWALL